MRVTKYPLHIDIRLWYLLQNVATPILIILTNFKFIAKSQMDRKSLNELILLKAFKFFFFENLTLKILTLRI